MHYDLINVRGQAEADTYTDVTSARRIIAFGIDNVDWLSNLTVAGGVSLQNNNLTHVDGLSNLTRVGSLRLSSNNLTNVDGLRNLEAVGPIGEDEIAGYRRENGSLLLDGNRLTSIDGLLGLRFIRSSLWLHSNPLTNLYGLANLTSLGNGRRYTDHTNGWLSIKDVALKNFDGLRYRDLFIHGWRLNSNTFADFPIRNVDLVFGCVGRILSGTGDPDFRNFNNDIISFNLGDQLATHYPDAWRAFQESPIRPRSTSCYNNNIRPILANDIYNICITIPSNSESVSFSLDLLNTFVDNNPNNNDGEIYHSLIIAPSPNPDRIFRSNYPLHIDSDDNNYLIGEVNENDIGSYLAFLTGTNTFGDTQTISIPLEIMPDICEISMLEAIECVFFEQSLDSAVAPHQYCIERAEASVLEVFPII